MMSVGEVILVSLGKNFGESLIPSKVDINAYLEFGNRIRLTKSLTVSSETIFGSNAISLNARRAFS